MRSQTRATKNELNIISKNNFVWNEIRTDAFEKASLVINDPWIVKILGEEDRCRSLKERERERKVVVINERRESRKSWFESRSRRCPLREIDAGETDGNQAAVWWISSKRVLIEIYFFPSPAFITNGSRTRR